MRLGLGLESITRVRLKLDRSCCLLKVASWMLFSWAPAGFLADMPDALTLRSCRLWIQSASPGCPVTRFSPQEPATQLE